MSSKSYQYKKHLSEKSKSDIDAVFAIKDIYGILLKYMDKAVENIENLSISGRAGIRWGAVAGESYFQDTENYLAADGIEKCHPHT